MANKIEYDRFGRMKYNPDFHDRHGKPWTTKEQQFLIDNYVLMGPEEVSFALGRTIHVCMSRAYELRKRGLMDKPRGKRICRRRTYAVRDMEVRHG